MKWLGRHWNHFWFEPVKPDNLGICRIWLYGTMFLFYSLSPLLFKTWGWHEDFTMWGKVSTAFWNPVWLFSVLHLPPSSTGTLVVIQTLWRVALALSCIGLFTRLSTAVSLCLGAYLFGLPNNYGKIHHLDQLLLWAFLAMAFSRCGDAWSIDALVRKARMKRGGFPAAAADCAPSGEYTWPIHMIWVISAMVYVEAGASKLRHSGISWVTTPTMQNYMLQAYYHVSDSEPLTRLGQLFARTQRLSGTLAAVSLVFEVGIIVALFSRRSRWLLVPGVVGMQAGIALFMGPNFYQMIMCQALWIPWDRVVSILGSRARKGGSYAIAFDGACGMCQRTMTTVKSLDIFQRVELLDTIKRWPEVEKKFPELDRDKAHAEMHVAAPDGPVTTGFFAYRTLARALPLGWIVLPFLYLPGVSSLGSHIYAAVASRRHRDVCELPALSAGKQ